jgi:hypothetical protein
MRGEIAILTDMLRRIRRQQGELFGGGVSVRHFAVVSNRWDMEGQALLEWQRGKAGTIFCPAAAIYSRIHGLWFLWDS